MNARARLVLVSTLIVAGVLILIGTTYQGVATALERRRYPHPGRLVDVGGHQLHVYCMGEGSPIVVLEAPAAAMSASWGWVQPEVARVTRVCAYDRSGLGWSEAGDRPYDPGRVPEELHSMLLAAHEPAPYVVAGASLGASFVRRFARLYPSDAAGLVLINPPDPGSGAPQSLTMSPWLARAGILRVTGLLSDNWKGLPAISAGPLSTFLNRPDHLTRASREIERWDDAVRLGGEDQLRPDLPVATVHAALNSEHSARPVTDTIISVVTQSRRARLMAPFRRAR